MYCGPVFGKMICATGFRSGGDKTVPVVLHIHPRIYFFPLDFPSLLYGPWVLKDARTT